MYPDGCEGWNPSAGTAFCILYFYYSEVVKLVLLFYKWVILFSGKTLVCGSNVNSSILLVTPNICRLGKYPNRSHKPVLAGALPAPATIFNV